VCPAFQTLVLRAERVDLLLKPDGLDSDGTHVDYRGMPTPHFTFRLPPDQALRLRQVAKIYGAVSASQFCREMVGAICGGTPEGASPFLQRLGMALGQQRQLDLFEEQKRAAAVIPAQTRRKKTPGRGRGTKRHDRTT